jgi:hypothetical protein
MQHSVSFANLPFKIRMREHYLSMNKLSWEGYLHMFKHDIRQFINIYYGLRIGQQLSAQPNFETHLYTFKDILVA